MISRPPNTAYRLRAGGTTKAQLLRQLDDAGVKRNALAEKLFDDERFIVTENLAFNEVFFISPSDLGFSEGATFSQVVTEAGKRGLALCPLDFAVHLRLQFIDQSEGAIGQIQTKHKAPPGSITVASAIPANEEAPWGFYLRRIEGVLWLRGYTSSLDHLHSPQDVFLFVVNSNAEIATLTSGE